MELTIKPKSLLLQVYTDSNFLNQLGGYCTSGCAMFLGGALVSWKSKKQSLVALSTTEAEYLALVEGYRDAIWIGNLLMELNYSNEGPWCMQDNQTCQGIVEGTCSMQRTRHIERKYQFLRDHFQKGKFQIQHVASEKQTADIFTKFLAPIVFNSLRKKPGY